jgi:hypothetical protein
MRTSIRSIAAWAPLSAALSMFVYGIALDVWPLQAGHLFASVFRLDPFTLVPIHGWLATLPGIAAWIAGSYASAAAGWALWHALRERSPQHSRWVMQDAAIPLPARRIRGS